MQIVDWNANLTQKHVFASNTKHACFDSLKNSDLYLFIFTLVHATTVNFHMKFTRKLLNFCFLTYLLHGVFSRNNSITFHSLRLFLCVISASSIPLV